VILTLWMDVKKTMQTCECQECSCGCERASLESSPNFGAWGKFIDTPRCRRGVGLSFLVPSSERVFTSSLIFIRNLLNSLRYIFYLQARPN
jgi:hypothetical protein